jgi:hypothetical protein
MSAIANAKGFNAFAEACALSKRMVGDVYWHNPRLALYTAGIIGSESMATLF